MNKRPRDLEFISFSWRMSSEEHRFYFSSKYSFQNKNLGEFTVSLPFSLELRGKWKATVCDVFFKLANTETDCIYILADFCDTSLVQQNKQLPILKKVYLNSIQNYFYFTHPLYIPVKQNSLSGFSLSFLDSKFEIISLGPDCLIECSIHFYKHGC